MKSAFELGHLHLQQERGLKNYFNSILSRSHPVVGRIKYVIYLQLSMANEQICESIGKYFRSIEHIAVTVSLKTITTRILKIQFPSTSFSNKFAYDK